jgi:hypothetical protein
VVLCVPGLLFIDSGPGPGPLALFLRVALAGSSLPQWRASRVGQPLALPARSAASRYALSAPMARALRARAATVRAAASLVAASRYALCARRRGRCAPVRRAGQPLAAITAGCHRAARSAPMVWPLRARAPAAAWSALRATRSAPVVWALCAPGRLHTLNVLLPVTCVRSTSWR